MAAKRITNRQHLTKFFKTGHRFQYKKGEIIARGDDVPKGVYFIEAGFVKVYSITQEGRENIRVILKPGELFPLIWAFGNTDKRSAIFYEAFGPTVLWRVSRDKFKNFSINFHEGALALNEVLVKIFSVYSKRINNLEFDNARDRVVFFLLTCAQRYGLTHGGSAIITAPIRHQHIADSLNMSRETVSRTLSRLERKKLISYKTLTSYRGNSKQNARHIMINKLKDLERRFTYPDRTNAWR